MKRIALLGATGSVGTSTIDVVQSYPNKFSIVSMSFHSNINKGRELIQLLHPSFVAVNNENDAQQLQKEFPRIQFGIGVEGLIIAATLSEVDIVLTAVSGSVGLAPTLAAIRTDKVIALANKETLVMGGELVMKALAQSKSQIIPVDSEHSAIFQCLEGQNTKNLDHLLITASGGGFRDRSRKELAHVTVADALHHPNWSMGPKITIDSSTMMNKGLEVIEAYWLFGLNYDKIKVVLHRESIVHSMVVMKDGAYLAQLGPSDMREPIQYALTYPDRCLIKEAKPFDLTTIGALHFEKMDDSRFPLLPLAYEVGKVGGTLSTVMNAANEIAVDAFLKQKISYLSIESLIQQAVDAHESEQVENFEQLNEIDKETRSSMQKMIEKGVGE